MLLKVAGPVKLRKRITRAIIIEKICFLTISLFGAKLIIRMTNFYNFKAG